MRTAEAARATVAEAAEREAILAILEKKGTGEVLSKREVARLGRWERCRKKQLLDEAFELGISQKKLCEYFNVSPKTVLRWEAKGMPRNPNQTYPLRRCLLWWKLYTFEQARQACR